MACVLISTKLHTVLRSLCSINNATEECLFDPWNSRNLGTIFLQSRAVQVSRGFLSEPQRTLLQCLIVISLRFSNTHGAFESFSFLLLPVIVIVAALIYLTEFSLTTESLALYLHLDSVAPTQMNSRTHPALNENSHPTGKPLDWGYSTPHHKTFCILFPEHHLCVCVHNLCLMS